METSSYNVDHRGYTETRAVERGIQTLENLNIAIPEDKIGFTKNKNQFFRVLGLSIHTGLQVDPFEVQNRRKLRTELNNIVKDKMSYLSHWKTMHDSLPPKQIPIYLARNEEGDVTDHIVMTRKNLLLFIPQFTEQKADKAGKWKLPIPVYTFREEKSEKNIGKKYKQQPEIAVDGTEHTLVRTTDNKFLYRKLTSTLLNFQRSPKKDPSPEQHILRVPSGKSECFGESTKNGEGNTFWINSSGK